MEIVEVSKYLETEDLARTMSPPPTNNDEPPPAAEARRTSTPASHAVRLVRPAPAPGSELAAEETPNAGPPPARWPESTPPPERPAPPPGAQIVSPPEGRA